LYDGLTLTISPVPGEANISPWTPLNPKYRDQGYAVVSEPKVEATAGKSGDKGGALELWGTKDVENGKGDVESWFRMIWGSGRMTMLAFKVMQF
jgi:hypothetical protein